MDVLLSLSEDRLFDWVWTDELLDEWERVIVREKHRTPASARSVTNAVRHWFATSRLDPETYRHQITDDLSPDEGDRVHVAACLAQDGVRVMTADAYLAQLLRRRPRAVQESIVGVAASRTRPPTTPCELVERLRRAGTPVFATRLGRRLECS